MSEPKAASQLRAAIIRFMDEVDAIPDDELVGAVAILILRSRQAHDGKDGFTSEGLMNRLLDWYYTLLQGHMRMFSLMAQGDAAPGSCEKYKGPGWMITKQGEERAAAFAASAVDPSAPPA